MLCFVPVRKTPWQQLTFQFSSDKQNETRQDLIVPVLCWVETNATTPGQKCRRAHREQLVVFQHKLTRTYCIISHSWLHRGQTLNVLASRPTVTSPCQGAKFGPNDKLLHTILLCYRFWVWELRSGSICWGIKKDNTFVYVFFTVMFSNTTSPWGLPSSNHNSSSTIFTFIWPRLGQGNLALGPSIQCLVWEWI